MIVTNAIVFHGSQTVCSLLVRYLWRKISSSKSLPNTHRLSKIRR